jgi:hypothetical protein
MSKATGMQDRITPSDDDNRPGVDSPADSSRNDSIKIGKGLWRLSPTGSRQEEKPQRKPKRGRPDRHD